MFIYLIKVLKKIRELGVLKLITRATDKLKKAVYTKLDEFNITKRIHNPPKLSNNDFLQRINNFTQKLQNSSHYKLLLPPKTTKQKAKQEAFCLLNNQIDLFKQKRSLPSEELHLWHSDWTKDPSFFWYNKKCPIFFSKIKITENNGEIKVPWEVGRSQFLTKLSWLNFNYNLGLSKKIEEKFFNTFESFERVNPFCLGVQWQNPMEVAIRACNWILTIGFLKIDKPELSNSLQKIITNLYWHKFFINHYLETSSTPNNHFLADLLGIVFIEYFLVGNSKKFQNLFQQTWFSFKNQIQEDGSFYEGSSAYHCLNLEMLLWLQELDLQLNLKIIDPIILKKAINFAQTLSFKKEIIQIGDDDSGKIFFGLFLCRSLKKQSRLLIHHHKDFGIIIVKNKDNLISLTNKNFNRIRQPTGHFHNDQLSITAIIKNKNLLIDPGTGHYTSNTKTRNQLRSIQSHNSFYSYLELEEEKKQKEIFEFFYTYSDKNVITFSEKITQNIQTIFISAENYDTSKLGYHKSRTLIIKFSQIKQEITSFYVINKANLNSSNLKLEFKTNLVTKTRLDRSSNPANYSNHYLQTIVGWKTVFLFKKRQVIKII